MTLPSPYLGGAASHRQPERDRVSPESDSDELTVPRATTALFGHTEAERALLDAYRSGRMPHAWLLGGPAGIGKATLAYRLARFVLAHPDPLSPQVQAASSLALDAQHPVARRVAAQAQGDLLVLERTEDEKGKMRTVIAVDQVRSAVRFFGSTAGEGGWRVCIIDTADELNAAAANSLLKVLEEPPKDALLLLVSDSPGQLLPTIRSRCRRLTLRPLVAADVAQAAAAALARAPDDPEVAAAAQAAEGSVARALGLIDGKMLAVREQVLGLLDRLPQLDARALHGLGDAIGGTEPATLAAFVDAVNGWLSARVEEGAAAGEAKPQLARMAVAWEAINRAAHDADEFNLDRKPLVFSVFGMLADAVR
jgi:DNA polymerase III subunit delta'